MIKTLVFSFLSISLLFPYFWPGYTAQRVTQIINNGLTLLQSDLEGIRIAMDVPVYQIIASDAGGERNSQIIVPGAVFSDEPGLPELPKFSTLVGVPPHAQISLVVVKDDSQKIAVKYQPETAPFPTLGTDDLGAGDFSDGTFAETLATDQTLWGEAFPVTPVRIAEEGWIRDQRFVRLEFFPFQYYRASSSLNFHQHIEIALHFTSPTQDVARGSRAISSPNPYFEQTLRGLLNYDSAREWRGLPHSKFSTESSSGNTPPGHQTSFEPRYKIPITQDKLYRLTYENLKLAGVPVDTFDPALWQLWSQGREAAIYFDDADQDQLFEAGEAFVFYGEKFYGDYMAQRYTAENINWKSYRIQQPDGVYTTWKPAMNATMLEKYTDENVYWLVAGTQPGIRINGLQGDRGENGSAREAPGSDKYLYLPLAQYLPQRTHRVTVHAEESHRWKTTLFAGEDTWFWDEIQTSSTDTRTYPMGIPFPVLANSVAVLRGDIVAATYNDSASPDHHIQVFLNDIAQVNPIIDATWDGKSRFHFEAQFPASRLLDGQNQVTLVVETLPTMAIEDLFVDWFEIEYDRWLQADGDQITFIANGQGSATYQVYGFSQNTPVVYEVTDPIKPIRVTNFTVQDGNLVFSAQHNQGAKFFAGIPEVLPASVISVYTPPDLTQAADYLLITHRDFVAGLQPLADFRASQAYSPLIIDVDDLYNEFNDGIYNPIAIKNFLAFRFANASLPTFVTLVGDGHWNFKAYPDYDSPPIYMPPNLVWVDPWQGEVDSANLLATVNGSDPIPDVFIGRIPVNNVQQLDTVVSKIIGYETAPAQTWQDHLLFVADDTPDPAGDFVGSEEYLISNYVPASYAVDRVYLDDFMDTGTCGSTSGDCPNATNALIDDLNQTGALLLTYFGHGSINTWAGEQILANPDVPRLTNNMMLPVILSMDCLDGYWFHPNISYASKSGPGLSEELLRASNGGAVATFSPTGLGVETGHDYLAVGFYEALFVNKVDQLGPLTQAAKMRLYITGVNLDLLHTFTLFGDPALKLPVQ